MCLLPPACTAAPPPPRLCSCTHHSCPGPGTHAAHATAHKAAPHLSSLSATKGPQGASARCPLLAAAVSRWDAALHCLPYDAATGVAVCRTNTAASSMEPCQTSPLHILKTVLKIGAVKKNVSLGTGRPPPHWQRPRMPAAAACTLASRPRPAAAVAFRCPCGRSGTGCPEAPSGSRPGS